MASDSLAGRSRAYLPTFNLAAAAVDIADAIDAEGGYAVTGLEMSQLPAVWFGGPPPQTIADVLGCISMDAPHRRSPDPLRGHRLIVFVAEVPNGERASDLADRSAQASTPGRPRVSSLTTPAGWRSSSAARRRGTKRPSRHRRR